MTTSCLQVELDLFSGRPNPSWALDEAESRLLLARLRLGRPCTSPRQVLGYRGFLVGQIDEAGVTNRWLRVGAGVITMFGDSPVAHEDAGGLEAHLLEQAAARGFGGFVNDQRWAGGEE